jgi:hypothetical protein
MIEADACGGAGRGAAGFDPPSEAILHGGE